MLSVLSYLKPFALPAATVVLGVGMEVLGVTNRFAAGVCLSVALILTVFAIVNNTRLAERFPRLSEWLLLAIAGDASPNLSAREVIKGPFVRGREFRIADITRRNRLDSITFEDCVVYGPGVLLGLDGGLRFVECAIRSTKDAFLLETSGEQTEFDGVIGCRDVTFRRCELVGISMLTTREHAAQMREDATAFLQAPPRHSAPRHVPDSER